MFGTLKNVAQAEIRTPDLLMSHIGTSETLLEVSDDVG